MAQFEMEWCYSSTRNCIRSSEKAERVLNPCFGKDDSHVGFSHLKLPSGLPKHLRCWAFACSLAQFEMEWCYSSTRNCIRSSEKAERVLNP